MAIFLAPFGKGTGKYWLTGLISLILLGAFLTSIGGLIGGVESGEISNPYLLLLAKVIYPIFILISWIVEFYMSWGIFAIVPITVVIVVVALAASWSFAAFWTYFGAIVKKIRPK